MKTSIIAALAIVLAAASLAVSLHRKAPNGASPERIAGEYVKSLAANAGVTIIGDKVWSVRTRGDRVLVIVRVRYKSTPTMFGVPVGPPIEQVTTIYVHELRSNYVVTG